ncbi:MAG: cysteine--tRNA ligase [Acidimicrobiia bacterium]|nr:cysteine--tRNA ligase [Acidimicrobiia bacterium]
MRLYDTPARGVVEFEPLRPGHISMYVCGPTVYAPPHLGHGRMAISFDLIRRYLVFAGWDVKFVSNYTDVDDKIIARARDEGVSADAVARKYEAVWDDAMRRLRVMPPDVAPRATDHVGAMVALVESLVESGNAYVSTSGDVLFSVRSFDGYGKLSHQSIEDLDAGARVEPGEHKRDPLDFALWKAAKEGEPSWPSPWGPGRPGWHIECSAMAATYCGHPFDIHGGGSDLIFPHHENEIAQSEAADGVVFARYWLHTGMVNLEGAKMSKSTGHFLSIEDALARYSPEAIRLLVAQTHYRNQLDFSPALVADSEAAVDRIATMCERAAEALGLDAATLRAAPAIVAAEPEAGAMAAFQAAMDDDFHTPAATAVLFDLVKRANAAVDRDETAELPALLAAIAAVDSVLQVVPPPARGDTALADVMELVLELRQRAREEKDYATADRIRDRLAEAGISVEDSPEGAKWRRRRR